MKTIGLIGGMSWESTSTYYEIINKTVAKKLNGLHSGKIILYSVDFAEIEEYQAKGQWDKAAGKLSEIAIILEKAGADFIVICTNTMHKVVWEIQKSINISILHIGEATGNTLKEDRIKKVLLLGTKYTMTQDFYKGKLESMGIKVEVPEDKDIEIINNIIYDELCLGSIMEKSKKKFIDIINSNIPKGVEGVILGCTEIGLLIGKDDVDIPVYDTTEIHAIEAVKIAMEK